MTDTYAGLPVRRGLFQCDDWQRMAEDLMAFQDAVQEALGAEEAGHVLAAIGRLKADAALTADVETWVKAQRESYRSSDLSDGSDGRTGVWWVLDGLLDDLREHLYTGTPLGEEVQGPHAEADR